MSELPKGWVEVEISKLGQIVTGKTPSTKNIDNFGGEVPFIKPGDLNEGGVIHKTMDTLTEKGLKLISSLPKNSIVVTCIGNLGKVGITKTVSATNQQINSVIPHEAVFPKYLYYQVSMLKPWLERESSATTVAIINKSKFSKAPITLAPLAEQKRIVEKLDQVLAQVDTIKARLDGIPAILKRFRQSVLTAAVSGKLTEEWRWGVKADYKNLKVEDIAGKQRYSLGIGPFGSNLKVDDYELQGHPLVFVREIRSKVFKSDKTKFVSDSKFEELKAHRVKPGDILITKMGDPPGDVAIYPNDRPEAVITADCIKLTVDPATAITRYVAYAMESSLFQKAVLAISAGVAQQKVNLKKFRIQYLPIPSLEEQIEIVRLVDQYFAFADTIEQQVQKAQQRVDKLTQSILAKAFRGELVPQNPDDEPADELLKRIAAARAEAEALAKAAKKVGKKK